jgi:hypothetical protein
MRRAPRWAVAALVLLVLSVLSPDRGTTNCIAGGHSRCSWCRTAGPQSAAEAFPPARRCGSVASAPAAAAGHAARVRAVHAAVRGPRAGQPAAPAAAQLAPAWQQHPRRRGGARSRRGAQHGGQAAEDRPQAPHHPGASAGRRAAGAAPGPEVGAAAPLPVRPLPSRNRPCLPAPLPRNPCWPCRPGAVPQPPARSAPSAPQARGAPLVVPPQRCLVPGLAVHLGAAAWQVGGREGAQPCAPAGAGSCCCCDCRACR